MTTSTTKHVTAANPPKDALDLPAYPPCSDAIPHRQLPPTTAGTLVFWGASAAAAATAKGAGDESSTGDGPEWAE